MNDTVKYHYSQCEDTKKAERITVLPLINGLLSCNSANHFIELCLGDAFNSQFDAKAATSSPGTPMSSRTIRQPQNESALPCK